MKHAFLVGILSITSLFGLTHNTQAAQVANVFTQTGEHVISIPLDPSISNNPSLWSADLGTDGVDELIIGNGSGAPPIVTVLRNDGSEIGSFLAYDDSMDAGVRVIACDLNADGRAELVTAPGVGYKPHVHVFDGYGAQQHASLAYAEQFTGGVHLACGNLDDQPGDELVTLPGVSGGPHVRVWQWQDNSLTLWKEWFAYEAENRNGLVGVVHDNNLIVANEDNTTVRVRTFTPSQSIEHTREEVVSLNIPGVSSLFLTNNTLYFSTAHDNGVLEVATQTFVPFHENITHGVMATTMRTTPNELETIITVGRDRFLPDAYKAIKIDLSEQRLYTYEHGAPVRSFLISSGRHPYKTPLGNHRILAKKPEVHYKWNYGPGNPNNYDLGVVPYNLQFYPHIYIHYAYWHNNFGTPQSHGCVNVNLENMKWVYKWAEEGIPVVVVP